MNYYTSVERLAIKLSNITIMQIIKSPLIGLNTTPEKLDDFRKTLLHHFEGDIESAFAEEVNDAMQETGEFDL